MRVTNTSSAGYSRVDIARSNTGIVIDFANEVCVVRMKDGWCEGRKERRKGGGQGGKGKREERFKMTMIPGRGEERREDLVVARNYPNRRGRYLDRVRTKVSFLGASNVPTV